MGGLLSVPAVTQAVREAEGGHITLWCSHWRAPGWWQICRDILETAGISAHSNQRCWAQTHCRLFCRAAPHVTAAIQQPNGSHQLMHLSIAFPNFQILPYILHRLMCHLNEPTWAKAQVQLSVLQNRDGLSLKQPHLVIKPLLKKLFKVDHFCTALISYQVPTPHTALQTHLNWPQQNSPGLALSKNWATAPSTRILLGTHQKPSSEDSHRGFFLSYSEYTLF